MTLNNQNREQDIQTWLEEQVLGIRLDSLEERKKAGICKILLRMAFSGLQVGILVGVGILRGVLSDLDFELSQIQDRERGSEELEDQMGRDPGKVEEMEKVLIKKQELSLWIQEGEKFTDDLEVVKEVIEERYSAIGGRRRIRRKRTERANEERFGEERSSGKSSHGVEDENGSEDEDLDVDANGSPPLIPERSDRRPKSSPVA